MIFRLVILSFILYSRCWLAQSGRQYDGLQERYLTFLKPDKFGFLEPYFPPLFIQDGLDMRSFVRSGLFGEIRRRYGDLKATDAIFIRAMKLTNENTAVALLISAVACFDHKLVGLKVPILALFFPLTGESPEEFAKRIANLPKNIYFDTPLTPTGDRDKLQHFFGSAFLAFIFESHQPAERFSDLIEKGEDAVIIDGEYDKRDIRANRHGQEFGLALLKNRHRLPSEFLATEISHPSGNFKMGKTDSVKSPGEE